MILKKKIKSDKITKNENVEESFLPCENFKFLPALISNCGNILKKTNFIKLKK